MDVCLRVYRFQRKVQAQPVEAGNQQPGVWPAHPLPYVHGREPPGCLGGGPETTAQVRHKHICFRAHAHVSHVSFGAAQTVILQLHSCPLLTTTGPQEMTL